MKIRAATPTASAIALALAGVLVIPGSAQATLHGFCSGAGQCGDNGTNSPTSSNPPVDFGFTTSPGPNTGDLFIDILTPDNQTAGPSFTLTGTSSATATLFSATPWTSGQLDSYLGISASPSNPIGAYLPSTQAVDPGATGFFVYQANLGTLTLQGPSSPHVSPLEDIGSGVLPKGSYVVGFFNEGTPDHPDYQATANSGAIFETGSHTSPVPEASPWAMMLLGFAGLGLAGYRKARSGRIAPSVA
jgi:hypothetical protein